MKITATMTFKESGFSNSVGTFLLGIKSLGNPTKEYEEQYCHSELC